MATATLKVLTMTDAEKATQVKELVSHLAGVQKVDTDLAVRNVKVEYDAKATTVTAMHKLLAVNFHRVAQFAAGSRKRGFVP